MAYNVLSLTLGLRANNVLIATTVQILRHVSSIGFCLCLQINFWNFESCDSSVCCVACGSCIAGLGPDTGAGFPDTAFRQYDR